MGAIVHLVLLADDVAVAALLLFPELVTQNENRRRTGLLVVWRKRASQDGLHSQELEKSGRNYTGAHAVRFGAADQRERHGVVLHQGAHAAIPLPVVVAFTHVARPVGDA